MWNKRLQFAYLCDLSRSERDLEFCREVDSFESATFLGVGLRRRRAWETLFGGFLFVGVSYCVSC